MSSELGIIIADFDTQNSTKVVAGDTTLTIQSVTDDDGNAIPSGMYVLSVDGDNSQKEYFIGTLDNTTGIITAIKSISRQGTISTGFVRTHKVGAEVKLTDFSNLYFITQILRGLLTLDGSSPLSYDTHPSFSSDTQLVDKKFVADTIVGLVGTATNTAFGTVKLSVAAASAPNPIVVGDNDPRVPTQNENNALVGNDISIAVGTTNKFVTQTGMQNRAETYAVTTGSSTNTVGNVTITIATPAVISLTAHGLVVGDVIQFTTSGALPTGLSLATNYYVISTGFGVNSFEVSATRGGSAVNTSGTQSGTQTIARPVNTYEATFSPIPVALVAGAEYELKTNFTNTGIAGANLANLGVYNIVKNGSVALSAGDILSGQIIKVKFDGTNLQLLSPVIIQTPSFQLLSTISVNAVSVASGSLTSLADFTGLLGDTDDDYMLEFELAASASTTNATVAFLALRFNGDSTSAHYAYNNFTNTTGTTVASSGVVGDTSLHIATGINSGFILDNIFGSAKIKGSKISGGTSRFVLANVVGTVGGGSAGLNQSVSSGTWVDTTNQMTEINLMFSQTTGSAVTISGKVSLYKINR